MITRCHVRTGHVKLRGIFAIASGKTSLATVPEVAVIGHVDWVRNAAGNAVQTVNAPVDHGF